jgi:hypothetical protein
VSSEMTGSWSSEQIASGLRLAESGVPVFEITRMLGVSPDVFFAWKAEYVEIFEKLVIRFAGPNQPNNGTKTTDGRRVAYLSGCAGGKEVENMLRECKLRFSVLENPATVACELLRSGSVLGNIQKPLSGHGLREAGGFLTGQARMNFFILVSAHIVNPKGDSPQLGAFGGETALSGVVSGEIDELRWRMEMAGGAQIDVPITQDVGLKFSLDGIFDAPIDAVRIFYTSPLDALLLGNLLIKKSEIPTTKAQSSEAASVENSSTAVPKINSTERG